MFNLTYKKSRIQVFFSLAREIRLPVGSGSNSTKHEAMVHDCLKKAGYIESKSTLTTKQKKDYKAGLRIDCPVAVGEFVAQPYGPQNNPDFIVNDPTLGLISIEAKSSQQKYPTYNSGYPSPEVIYVFTSTHKSIGPNQTVLFLGADALTPEQREIIKIANEEMKEYVANVNSQLRGLGDMLIYPRVQLQASKSNYFRSDFGSIFASQYGTETRAIA
jgi:hypothetical protein